MHWRSWQREGLHPVQEHIFRESGCAKGSFGGCLLQAGAGEIWLLFDALTVLYISRRSRCAGAKTYRINIYSVNFFVEKGGKSLWLTPVVHLPRVTLAGAGT